MEATGCSILCVAAEMEAAGRLLATILLLLAVLVLIGFCCFAIPQAIRLRAALAAIQGGTEKDTEQQKRAAFVRDYREIDQALQSNKATSIAWQEFRKNLIIRRDQQQRTTIINSTPNRDMQPHRRIRGRHDH